MIIKLTLEQNALYDKLMGCYLTQGLNEDEAEEQTVKELIETFPELMDLNNPDTKIEP